jgi:hypothetical protein
MMTQFLLFQMPHPEILISARSPQRAFWMLWLFVVLALLCFPMLGMCQTAITCGQTITNTTTTISQVDQYSYAGTAGQVVSFALWSSYAPAGGGPPMVADVYSPTGQLLMTVTVNE